MNLSWIAAGTWLLHCALGGGLILLVTVCLMRLTRQPARRQRLGEFGLAASLVVAVLSLVGPTWVVVAWPVAAEEKVVKVEAPAAPPPAEVIVAAVPDWALVDFNGEVGRPQEVTAAPSAPLPPESVGETEGGFWSWQTTGQALIAAFAAVAGFFLLRWVLGLCALARMLGKAAPAPRAIALLFHEMARARWRARLLMSRRLRVPVSCGLLRPTVLLPHVLCEPADFPKLRWVFAHELTHVERRDAWSCLLLGLGQVLFFYVPWFWWLKRQVRLCQEYVADAAAVAALEETPSAGAALADYAEFLLSLTRAPAPPLAATGVSGNKSDLYRRVSMLLEQPLPVQRRCPRSWAFFAAAGLLALAVLVVGVGLQAEAAQKITIIIENEPGKKAEPEVKVIRVPADHAKRDAQPHKIVVDKEIFIQRVGPDGKIIIERHGAGTPAPHAGPKDGIRKGVLKLLVDKDAQWQPIHDLLKKLDGKGIEIELHIAPPKPEQEKNIEFKWLIEKKTAADPKKLKELEDTLRKLLNQLEKGDKVDPAEIRKAIDKALSGRADIHSHKEMIDRAIEDAQKKEDQSRSDEAVKRGLEFLAKNQAGDGAVRKAVEFLQKAQSGDEDELVRRIFLDILGTLPPADRLRSFRESKDPKKLAKLIDEVLNTKAELDQFPPGLALIVRNPTTMERFGLKLESPSAALADQLNLPKGQGLVVAEVKADSAATKAGFMVNDVLIKVNNQAVASDPRAVNKLLPQGLAFSPDGKKLAATFDAVVLRKGKQLVLPAVTLSTAETGIRLGELKNVGKGNLPKVAGNQVMITTTRGEKGFTTRYQEGALTIIVTGKVEDGKARVGEIHVQDGEVNNKYQSVDQVPARYRDKVNHAIQLSTFGGSPNQAK